MPQRLHGFDYTLPYYYMVTLKRLPSLAPFSEIKGPCLQRTPLTETFLDIITNFHKQLRAIEPIWCFIIMPDHIHLLIKLCACDKPMALGSIVSLLMRSLAKGYWATLHCPDTRLPVFERTWHDWIVKRDGQLTAFIKYISENPRRHWLRKSNAQYFQRMQPVVFLGREWYCFGNPALLTLPVIVPFRCSRSWEERGIEWQRAIAMAHRLGPGCAGISTFMSPCEKACGNAIGASGGSWIVLSPEGFGSRWHPPREKESFCAQGRMLFLSLYPAREAAPSNAELYQRCHEMGDLVQAAIFKG